MESLFGFIPISELCFWNLMKCVSNFCTFLLLLLSSILLDNAQNLLTEESCASRFLVVNVFCCATNCEQAHSRKNCFIFCGKYRLPGHFFYWQSWRRSDGLQFVRAAAECEWAGVVSMQNGFCAGPCKSWWHSYNDEITLNDFRGCEVHRRYVASEWSPMSILIC